MCPSLGQRLAVGQQMSAPEHRLRSECSIEKQLSASSSSTCNLQNKRQQREIRVNLYDIQNRRVECERPLPKSQEFIVFSIWNIVKFNVRKLSAAPGVRNSIATLPLSAKEQMPSGSAARYVVFHAIGGLLDFRFAATDALVPTIRLPKSIQNSLKVGQDINIKPVHVS